MSLPFNHLQDQSFGNLLQILIDKVCCLADSLSGYVQSVTATNASVVVDNTDPQNPTVGLPYTVYRALLTQSGIGAPTAVVLENTLGETPTFVQTGPGAYRLQTVGNVFTSAKTFITGKHYVSGNDITKVFTFQYSAATTINLYTSVITVNAPGGLLINTATDSLLSSTEIEILVYP